MPRSASGLEASLVTRAFGEAFQVGKLLGILNIYIIHLLPVL